MKKDLIITHQKGMWVDRREETIERLIDDSLFTYDSTEVDVVREKNDKSLKLLSDLITIMYNKGLLNDDDIKEMLGSYFDYDRPVEIKIKSYEK